MVNAKKKGNRAELKATKLLEDWSGKSFSRVPQSGGLGWSRKDTKGDVICSTEGHYFPFVVEVKNQKEIEFNQLLLENTKKNPILDFWDQVINDSEQVNKEPLLLMRYNNLPNNFFFVVLKPFLFNEIVNRGYIKNPKPFLNFQDSLILTNTNVLFRARYKRVRKLAKRKLNYG